MKLYATLYHGSNVDFDEINLQYGNSIGMEFGHGFYLTPDYEIAKQYALDAYSLSQTGRPKILEYEFDVVNALLDDDLDIRKFDKLDMDWFNFVSANLHNSVYHNSANYDVIIGPLEQSDAWAILSDFDSGVISFEEVRAKIKPLSFHTQITFTTQKALKYLKKIGVQEVEND